MFSCIIKNCFKITNFDTFINKTESYSQNRWQLFPKFIKFIIKIASSRYFKQRSLKFFFLKIKKNNLI